MLEYETDRERIERQRDRETEREIVKIEGEKEK